jgi:hypothetical protein
MPRKGMVVWLFQNFVEFRPETTYWPVCNVWGYLNPYKLKF